MGSRRLRQGRHEKGTGCGGSRRGHDRQLAKPAFHAQVSRYLPNAAITSKYYGIESANKERQIVECHAEEDKKFVVTSGCSVSEICQELSAMMDTQRLAVPIDFSVDLTHEGLWTLVTTMDLLRGLVLSSMLHRVVPTALFIEQEQLIEKQLIDRKDAELYPGDLMMVLVTDLLSILPAVSIRALDELSNAQQSRLCLRGRSLWEFVEEWDEGQQRPSYAVRSITETEALTSWASAVGLGEVVGKPPIMAEAVE